MLHCKGSSLNEYPCSPLMASYCSVQHHVEPQVFNNMVEWGVYKVPIPSVRTWGRAQEPLRGVMVGQGSVLCTDRVRIILLWLMGDCGRFSS